MLDINVAGLTVQAVHADENHDGWPTTVIEFTDGTALRVVAHGQEEADQSVDLINSDDAASLIAEFDRREQERAARQGEIDAFNALPAEEQDRIRAERRAKMSPLERALWDSIMGDYNRGPFYKTGEVTMSTQLLDSIHIPVAPSKPRKARRS